MKTKGSGVARTNALTRRTVTALAVVLLLGGCTTTTPATSTAPAPAVTTTTVAATTTSSAQVTTTLAPTTTTTTVVPGPIGATITIAGFDFGSPASIEAGQAVLVVNTDAIGHTWTSDSGLFDSGVLGLDSEFTFTFSEPGEYSFFCRIHPSMTGTLSVSE